MCWSGSGFEDQGLDVPESGIGAMARFSLANFGVNKFVLDEVPRGQLPASHSPCLPPLPSATTRAHPPLHACARFRLPLYPVQNFDFAACSANASAAGCEPPLTSVMGFEMNIFTGALGVTIVDIAYSVVFLLWSATHRAVPVRHAQSHTISIEPSFLARRSIISSDHIPSSSDCRPHGPASAHAPLLCRSSPSD